MIARHSLVFALLASVLSLIIALLVAEPAVGESEPAPTWAKDIKPIFDQHCVGCHRKDGGGPFVLTSWGKAANNKAMLKRVVEQRRMPPWFADGEVGTWANDARLSDDEIAKITTWVDAGAPQGPEAAKEADGHKESSGEEWSIGKPDKVYNIGSAIEIPATGKLDYFWQTIVTDFPDDRWVTALEVKASNPEILHHAMGFLYYPGGHERSKDFAKSNGMLGCFVSVVPGHFATIMPEGMGKYLPSRGRLRFQIHCATNGEAQKVQLRLALKLTDKKPDHEVISTSVSDVNFLIPPGAKDFPVEAKLMLDDDVRILSFLPHMHVRGTSFVYEAKQPGQDEFKPLLKVPHYDFNWQLNYIARTPVELPKGTMLRARATYDNSADNPANPDPNQRVGCGKLTGDEMMIGYFEYVRQARAEGAPEGKAAPKD